MLAEAFPKFESSAFVQMLRAFYRSALYPFAVAALMVLAEFFSIELPVYYLYFVFAVAGLLFTEDALCLLPIACCAYMTVSPENNPTFYPETSALLQPYFLLQTGFMVLVCLLLMVGQLILLRYDGKKTGIPALSVGFVCLGVGYLLAGSYSPYYAADTILFGLIEIASLVAVYVYFFYSVRWETVEKGYLPALFLAIGIGLLFEIVDMYTLPGVFSETGTVNRGALYTGWASYNNIGCVEAMCIPATCYFAVKSRQGWAYSALGCLFLLGVCLTQSRGSILFGSVVFFLSAVVSVCMSRSLSRLKNLLVYGLFAVGIAIAYYCFSKQLELFFASLVEAEWNSSGRFEIYKSCLAVFRRWPVFGAGFYHALGDLAPQGTTPGFAHNTYIQLLATGGLFLLLAYLIHRAETLLLFFRRPSMEKAFVALSVLALILTSLVDLHFFAIGPGILYGVLLVYAECVGGERERRLQARARRAAERRAAEGERESRAA